MDNGLFVINVHAIVGHEYARRSAVAFGVNELVQRITDGKVAATACLRSSLASCAAISAD